MLVFIDSALLRKANSLSWPLESSSTGAMTFWGAGTTDPKTGTRIMRIALQKGSWVLGKVLIVENFISLYLSASQHLSRVMSCTHCGPISIHCVLSTVNYCIQTLQQITFLYSLKFYTCTRHNINENLSCDMTWLLCCY